MIVFEKCDASDPLNNCKPKDDIQAWLSGKYLIVLENNIKFVHQKMKEDKWSAFD